MLVAASVFLWCASLLAEGTFSLAGQVRTGCGAPVPAGAMVRLETREGALVTEQPLNPDGRFEFERIPKINYRLIATAPGFVFTMKEIDVNLFVDQAFVDLILASPSATPGQRRQRPGVLIKTDNLAPKAARKDREKGAMALKEQQLGRAREHFESAVRVYPCYARAQADLASVLILLQDLPPAERALRKAIECDAAYLDAYFRLAQLLNNQKRFGESAALLKEPSSRAGSAWQLHYQMAVSHFGLGHYAEAEEEYRKVWSLNAQPPPEVHVELASVYLKEHAYEKAYTEMAAYLREATNSPSAPSIRKTMQQMESTDVVRHAPGF